MWAELWTGWLLGHEIRVPKEFDFCWATDGISRWNDLAFFHNAGVTGPQHKQFFKADYISRLPYNEILDINPDSASYKYWLWVRTVSKKSVLK
jgi:hypothetical protein